MRPISKVRKKREDRIIKIVAIIFATIVFLILISALLLRINKIVVSNVEVKGNMITKTEELKDFVMGELSGNYYYIFPKKSVFIYPQKTIEAKAYERFSRLYDVNVKTEDSNTVSISVKERRPEYLWCGTGMSNEENSAEDCYFLDNRGYIFSKAPHFSGYIYFKFYGPLANFDDSNPIKSFVLREDMFAKVLGFRDSLKNLSLGSYRILILNNGDFELYLNSGGKVMFNQTGDYEKLAKNLELALNTEPLLGNMKDKKEKLDYIDLRFGNKVFFKFK